MPYPTPTVTLFCDLGVEDGTSPRFTFSNGSPTITKTWKTKESEYNSAKVLLAGDVKIPAIALNGYFERWNPHKLPRFRPVEFDLDPTDTTSYFYCSTINSVTGLKWMSESNDGAPEPTPPAVRTDVSNVWKYHHIEATYERPVYDIKEDANIDWEFERYCSEGEVRLSADYITMPGGVIVYRRSAGGAAPDNRTIPFNVGRVFPTLEVPITWHGVPQAWYNQFTILWERLYGTSTTRSYVGSVNKKAIFGRPPGTMLFSGVEPRRRITPVGRIVWDLTFVFGFDPNGWNFKYFWDTTGSGFSGFYLALQKGALYPASPIYDNLVDDAALYNARDHRLLFWVADEALVAPPP